MRDDNVKRSLIYINANFGILADSITTLETSRLNIYDSIKIIKDLIESEIKLKRNLRLSN